VPADTKILPSWGSIGLERKKLEKRNYALDILKM